MDGQLLRETLDKMQREINELKYQVSKTFELLDSMVTLIGTLQAPSCGKETMGTFANFSNVSIVGKKAECSAITGHRISPVVESTPSQVPTFGNRAEKILVRRCKGKASGEGKQKEHQPSFQPPYLPSQASSTQVNRSQHRQWAHPACWPPKQFPQNPPICLPKRHTQKVDRFDPVPIPYSQLLPQLLQKNLVSLVPLPPLQPPYPDWYDESASCAYHGGAKGHSLEDCIGFKKKVQSLIDAKWLDLKTISEDQEANPNLSQNHKEQNRDPMIGKD